MLTYQNVEGYFSIDQREFYQRMIKFLPSPCKICEIGVYMGKSTIYFVQALLASGKEFEYHVVDHFKGSEEHQESLKKRQISLFDFFMNNVNRALVLPHIIIHNKLSEDAAKSFQEGYFDFVFIDASHDYENVKKDILTWLPKVKEGGTLAGDDWSKGWAGLQKAVRETMDGKKFTTKGRVWKHVKGGL